MRRYFNLVRQTPTRIQRRGMQLREQGFSYRVIAAQLFREGTTARLFTSQGVSHIVKRAAVMTGVTS